MPPLAPVSNTPQDLGSKRKRGRPSLTGTPLSAAARKRRQRSKDLMAGGDLSELTMDGLFRFLRASIARGEPMLFDLYAAELRKRIQKKPAPGEP